MPLNSDDVLQKGGQLQVNSLQDQQHRLLENFKAKIHICSVYLTFCATGKNRCFTPQAASAACGDQGSIAVPPTCD